MKPNEMLEPVIDRMNSDANVKRVFGEPFEAHGKTLVPVAKIAYGFGGGAGRGKHHGNGTEEGEGQEGGGMGGGVRTTPAGVLEITDEETRFVSFTPNWKLVGLAALGLFFGLRIGRRQGRKIERRNHQD